MPAVPTALYKESGVEAPSNVIAGDRVNMLHAAFCTAVSPAVP